MKYDNKLKYKVIEEICSGKTYIDIKKEYGISHSSIMSWFKDFINNESFTDNIDCNSEEYLYLISLKEAARKRELQLRQHGNSISEDMGWLLEFNPDLLEWKEYSNEWLNTIIRSKSTALRALTHFFKNYIIPYSITTSVAEFVSQEYDAPDFYKIVFSSRKSKSALVEAKKVTDFIDWILINKFSVENDYGKKIIPPEFHNPLTQFIPEYKNYYNRSESDKTVLPYRYIKVLRDLLCPSNAMNFRDLHFAQSLLDNGRTGGDWYIVDKSIIDVDDPDCVYRIRKTSNYQLYIKKRDKSDIIYEMWCPARTICLLTKLMLPIRTYQARMLDSGEMDTYKYIQTNKYEHGRWEKNDSPLSQGTEIVPCEKGVLRKFIDPTTNLEMTGFFINTNKTADINKDEADKGYNMPWQYEEIQYWLAKLRDWQQKYNPISKPTYWTELTSTQTGNYKDKRILDKMGTATFLFRDAAQERTNLPLGSNSLNPLWYNLLKCLERNINQSASNEAEKNLKFVHEDSHITTYYPLHSLRVSLITAFSLEGGVPMPVLSKCIAGHARLVMTLYYAKMGISYVTDTMKKADAEILKQDREAFARFIKDANYKQLQNEATVNDTVAYEAVLNAQQTKASIIVSDIGICPKGCFGCDTGGIYVNDDTDKVTYGVVQGYPAHNCVRCRWFISGPAFLPGLVNHFNVLSYAISETAKRISRFQNQTELLENERFEAEQNNGLFDKYEDLLKSEQFLQQEIQKVDDIANNMNATLRLIDKCQKISKDGENVTVTRNQLVPVGTIQDIRFMLESEADELHQLQAICNGAEIFPETDASKALLKRSQIIDLTLMTNNKKPIMFSLSDEEQLLAGNQFMRLLIQRSGSLKDAIPYAVGRKKLEEIGIVNEFTEEISGIGNMSPKALLSNISTD